jgi:hypothetical protein
MAILGMVSGKAIKMASAIFKNLIGRASPPQPDG